MKTNKNYGQNQGVEKYLLDCCSTEFLLKMLTAKKEDGRYFCRLSAEFANEVGRRVLTEGDPQMIENYRTFLIDFCKTRSVPEIVKSDDPLYEPIFTDEFCINLYERSLERQSTEVIDAFFETGSHLSVALINARVNANDKDFVRRYIQFVKKGTVGPLPPLDCQWILAFIRLDIKELVDQQFRYWGSVITSSKDMKPVMDYLEEHDLLATYKKKYNLRGVHV